MKLASDSFRNRAAMPSAQLATGGNRHPQLRWSEVPAGTASLALLCLAADRPDGDFCHWSVVDIPPSLTSLAAGALPAADAPPDAPSPTTQAAPDVTPALAPRAAPDARPAIAPRAAPDATPAVARCAALGVPLPRQGLNDFGRPGYAGPAPAAGGARHYIFRLYALDVPRLDLPASFTGADVLNAIYGHIIDEAQLIGAYTYK
ncbi:hypothetical protein FHW58_005114 [Duganella sp. 1224]|uniref:YbhB/YbcL family Raf kinase inhibitor-like protein n=1 Tax=Duganella sp. 1224 TaxID=2587052 RepID=UPI0015C9AC06|nr:phospholipid-binding protein [Duganella sp. 1224]NYE63880.1 hypothetical protein [Duganella sp. 1224]